MLRTFVPLSSPNTGTFVPACVTAATSYPLSLPINPLTAVCLSGTTWYNDRGPESATSEDSRPLRSSKKSGVSSPPGTVDTTLCIPEGVSSPEGVWRPSPGAASASSGSDSSSLSDSESSKERIRWVRHGERGLRAAPLTFFLRLKFTPSVSVDGRAELSRTATLTLILKGTVGNIGHAPPPRWPLERRRTHHRIVVGYIHREEAYPSHRGGNPTVLWNGTCHILEASL